MAAIMKTAGFGNTGAGNQGFGEVFPSRVRVRCDVI